MTRLLIVALVVAAACGRPALAEDEPPEISEMSRLHMRQHFNDLRTIERLLLAGELELATTMAFLLAKPSEPGLAEWQAYAREVALAAGELQGAASDAEALRSTARIAETCAECHTATRAPVFAEPSKPPAARTARHRWAVDRLWEGVVGASDEHWRAGLAVIAKTPAPPTQTRAIGARLQELARVALEQDDPSVRATTYGEMLVTCAACHTKLKPRASSVFANRMLSTRP